MNRTDTLSLTGRGDDGQLLRWFALLVLIGPIHMAEQLLSGLDTLNELKGLVNSYYAHFSNPDMGTVLLVIFLVTVVQLLLLAALAGGRWRLAAAAFFGMSGVGEAHHLLQAAAQGGYFPGLISAIAYVWFGVMILRAVIRQWPKTEVSMPGRAVEA